MELIAVKTIEVRRPKSLTDPNYEQYEYMLFWFGNDGGVYSWIFENKIESEKINSEIYNTKTANIQKIFEDVNKTIEITAEDLTENQFDTIATVLKSKNVFRMFKNGTFDKITIGTDQLEKRQTDGRFNLRLQIVTQQPAQIT